MLWRQLNLRCVLASLCVTTMFLLCGLLYLLQRRDVYFYYDEEQRVYLQSSYRHREHLLPHKTFNVSEVYDAGFHVDNRDLCRRKTLRLLILVTSAPRHFKPRMGIRMTWAGAIQHGDVAVSFLVGATSNATLMKSLLDESVQYGDLIVTNNHDSYQNLTLKSISLLEWTLRHCANASFVLKTDDDVFLNVNRLLGLLDGKLDVRWTMFGRLVTGWEPVRVTHDKYHLSWDQYSGTVLPTILTGPAYVMSGDVVRPLYVAALRSRFVVLEDVFLTGVLADQLGIDKVNVCGFHELFLAETWGDCKAISEAITIHNVTFANQFYFWRKVQDAIPCGN